MVARVVLLGASDGDEIVPVQLTELAQVYGHGALYILPLAFGSFDPLRGSISPLHDRDLCH